MKTRRSLVAAFGLFLLVGLTALLWGDQPAAAAVTSTKTILVKGTVDTNAPESIPFSGKIQIKTTVVPDPDFGAPPSVHFAIDVLDVQGLGATTKTKYFAIEEVEMMRFLVDTDRLDLVFAIATDPAGETIVGLGLVSVTFTFDSAGNLTAATGSVTNNPFAPNL
jgi:hypothetical protein